MVFQKKSGFTLVEALISLGLLAFISILSVKLLEPPPRQNSYGRKAGDFIEHLVSVHRQVELSRGRAPLTPNLNLTNRFLDLDNVPATTELGFPVSLMQTETQANYCTSAANPECSTWANRDFLDYPGGMRLYVRPEQFTWVNTLLGTAPLSITDFTRTNVVPTTTNRYRVQSFLLLDMDPATPPTALDDDDLILLYLNNEANTIATVAQEAINARRATPPLANGSATFTCSFYDVHKSFNACTAIGGTAVLGI
jgi:type II secretory pathway pseudopilin PulG